MTDRMNDEQFDRQIRDFLAWHAADVAEAPSASAMAARIGARGGTIAAVPRFAPRLAWAVIGALAIAGLLGALLIGSTQQRREPLGPTAYEALFLRVEGADGNPELVAVGVRPDGHEREIARLRDPGMTFPVGKPRFFAGASAVSPGGLIAIPATRDGWLVQWEIFDLHHPETAPIVVPGIEQDTDQIPSSPYHRAGARPGTFWGPGERVAIPWYERLDNGRRYHLGFYDGRAAAVANQVVPDGLGIRPDWASDGSGVFLDDGSVLGPGGFVGGSALDAVPNCRTVDRTGVDISSVGSSDFEFACLAPDDSAIAERAATGQVTLRAPGDGTARDVDGSFAGWIGVDAPPSETNATPQPTSGPITPSPQPTSGPITPSPQPTWAPVTPSPEPPAGAVPPAYEAVFVRLETADGTPEVVVVGVNDEGRERELARLPDAWVSYEIENPRGLLAPVAVVSPGGLLAIPGNHGEAALMMHWEVIDLHQPQAEPFVVPGVLTFIEELRETPYYTFNARGGSFWGPGERLAILWYYCSSSCTPNVHLTVFDGRTGATSQVDDANDVRPYWAADGSGVFVGGEPGDDAAGILRPDGRVIDATGVGGEPWCRTRDRSGAVTAITEDGRVVRRRADGSREDVLAVGGAVYACLAPDDSAIVTQGIGTSGPIHRRAQLIVPGTGTSFDIDGNFAGWMEVNP